MIVIGGSAGARAAEGLAKELGGVLGAVDVERFPDGEAYVRIRDDLAGEDVVVVQTTHPDANLVEALLLQDAAHRQGPRRLVTAIPYMGYARQDQLFHPGESVSAQALAEALSLKADGVATVDPHKAHLLGFFSVEAASDSAVPELAAHFQGRGVDVVLAPDKGALERAEAAAAALGAEVDHLEKTRISGTEVEVRPKRLDVADRAVLIVDDIISTGGTMVKATERLKAQGAAAVYAACTHGLFVNDATARLTAAGCDEVVATDSIPGDASKVSVAPALARAVAPLLE